MPCEKSYPASVRSAKKVVLVKPPGPLHGSGANRMRFGLVEGNARLGAA